jgi:hypothetical protein
MEDRPVNQYRITVRYGQQGYRYHTLTLEAHHLAEALRELADRLPPDVRDFADLAEIRSEVRPEEREYGPE